MSHLFFFTTICQNHSICDTNVYKTTAAFSRDSYRIKPVFLSSKGSKCYVEVLRVLTGDSAAQCLDLLTSVESELWTNPAPFPAAPPDYSSVVTEEEAEQRNNAVVPPPAEDLSGILERPLMAFVQEFRFRPPPVYCEVSSQMLLPPSFCVWTS